MQTDPISAAQAALSSRRSLGRCRALVVLDARGAMFPNELADACGMDAWRLRQVMHGDGEDYSVERAPISLGQAVLVPTSTGDVYVITPVGRAEAARLLQERAWEVGRRR